jgi:cell wall-associated NlpC family hydrolase
VTDVEHTVLSTYRPARVPSLRRRVFPTTVVVAMTFSTLAIVSPGAGASNITNSRHEATILLSQINRINGEVGRLGQKYDEAQIKLRRLTNEIANTKAMVEQVKSDVTKGNNQLRSDVIFAFVTSGATEGNNPLFSSNASKLGSTSVYTQLAEGNISSTIANLKNYRIKLIQDRGLLRAEDANARAVTVDAASSFHKSKLLQASLNHTLAQVKGQIATDVNQEEAAAAAASAGTLSSAGPVAGFPAPPPDSRANIAIREALSYLNVPYVWGGASRSGVDCSGLVMLAYDAAGIYLPHYSGAQYDDTERVPLYDIEPGDLLFYGPGGDEHVAMYLGKGMMIEAPETGQVVHVTPIRLYGGFVGLGRPRA